MAKLKLVAVVSHANYLNSFQQLSGAASAEERLSLFRQAITTLARACLDQQPLPLEGMSAEDLLSAAQVALQWGLLDELSWLSPTGAAAAVYELALALPPGPEHDALERLAVKRLYSGNAATVATLANAISAHTPATLEAPGIQARMALALTLPGGHGEADALALTLLAHPELRQHWLLQPARGALSDRRLAAQLLERAARETARRFVQGDAGCLRVFFDTTVQAHWKQLLADREPLVFRHVAAARGLLAHAVPEWSDEVRDHLQPEATPTQWRRAAVSLAASIASDGERAASTCHDVLLGPLPAADAGLPGTMLYGLHHTLAAEPDLTAALLQQIVQTGSLQAAEALSEFCCAYPDNPHTAPAREYCLHRLGTILRNAPPRDDGKAALCQALLNELSDPSGRPATLREHLTRAHLSFATSDSAAAQQATHAVVRAAEQTLLELEQTHDADNLARQDAFVALRELELTLLESGTLQQLQALGPQQNGSPNNAPPLDGLLERLAQWLVRMESRPESSGPRIDHITLRQRRLRSLLRLLDVGSSQPHSQPVIARNFKGMHMLLGRVHHDRPSGLTRVLGAALARTCDALLRQHACELSDVLIVIADHVRNTTDLHTLAEASMLDDLRRCTLAYAALSEHAVGVKPSGTAARDTITHLSALGQALPVSGPQRVRAMRRALLSLAADLTTIATASTLPALMQGAGRTALKRLAHTLHQLALFNESSRQRLLPGGKRIHHPSSGDAVHVLDLAFEKRLTGQEDQVDALLASSGRTFDKELPLGIAHTVHLVVSRAAHLPLEAAEVGTDSFTVLSGDDTPLPPWLPTRRTLGGFYVLHALGNGGVGSVFVVVRAEERHSPGATRFALKVPDYDAEAARSLSEQQFLALFRHEAGALLALPPHPNLASFVTFDAGTQPKPILVMELVDGPTLDTTLYRGDITMGDALFLLEGVGEGLECMHAQGLGHLDLKPSNVILKRPRLNGKPLARIPVLVDFGLAGRQLRPGCATGPYGAPEIWGLASNDRPAPPMPADTYAYACLAFETLTGQRLFTGDNELEVINAHLVHDGYPERLMELRIRCPELSTFCDLIANGLRQDPSQRISVSQMRAGLRSLRPQLAPLPWPIPL